MNKEFYKDINKIIAFDAIKGIMELLILGSATLGIICAIEPKCRDYLVPSVVLLFLSILFRLLEHLLNKKIKANEKYYEFIFPKQIDYDDFWKKLYDIKNVDMLKNGCMIYRFFSEWYGSLGIILKQKTYDDGEFNKLKLYAKEEFHKKYKCITYFRKYRINFLFIDLWTKKLENRLLEVSPMSKKLVTRISDVEMELNFFFYKNKVYTQSMLYGTDVKSHYYKKVVKKIMAYLNEEYK